MNTNWKPYKGERHIKLGKYSHSAYKDNIKINKINKADATRDDNDPRIDYPVGWRQEILENFNLE